jgi:acyl-CoA synthetase (AMP-forming)/AMP-acid ligase II
MGLRDFNLYDQLRHNALTAGESPAVIASGNVVSHREFLLRVDRLAAGLTASGIAKGDRLCILAQNSCEYLELYGACAKTGAIAFPINWRLSASEVAGVVALADAQMLIAGAAHLSHLDSVDMSKMRARAVIGSASGFTPFTDLYRDAVTDPADVCDDDPFVIVPTAAVAAIPRGAVLTYRNLTSISYSLNAALGITAQDRHLAALPLFHITGLGLAYCLTLVGGVNVVMESFDPARASQLIDEHHVTLLADFPPVLSMLLDARAQSGATWQSLKHVVGLDAPDTIKRLYTETGAKFWTGFGQSETSGLVTLTRVDMKPGSAGRAAALARVRCVNEKDEDVPTGEPGEIAVRGPFVFSGYWRDADATHYALRNGWHHTGDIGKFDADGYLYYVGRKPEKELIKSGGENVYPAEVERVIGDLPQVAAVCVIGVPHPKWGEAVKAVVELNPGKTLTAEQIVAAVVERIAAYKKPQVVDFVERLPRKENGEIDRQAVKAAHS